MRVRLALKLIAAECFGDFSPIDSRRCCGHNAAFAAIFRFMPLVSMRIAEGKMNGHSMAAASVASPVYCGAGSTASALLIQSNYESITMCNDPLRCER